MTMATGYNNRLITPDLEKSMKDYPLYSQDSKKKDALCIAVFFIGNTHWYIPEGQRIRIPRQLVHAAIILYAHYISINLAGSNPFIRYSSLKTYPI